MYTPKSHEELQASLNQVLELLEKGRVLETLAHSQVGPKRDLLEDLAHRQNVAALHNRLRTLHPADLAHILEALPPRDRPEAWAGVAPGQAAHALVELSESVRDSLLERTSRERTLEILKQLDADDLAWLADALGPGLVEEAAAALDATQRTWVHEAYPDGSVGRLMSSPMATTLEQRTFGEVQAELSAAGDLPAQADSVFVVDVRNVLRGVVPLRALLTRPPSTLVSEALTDHAPTFTPEDRAQQAAAAFERYDLVSAPVVDGRGKLIGRLTVDAVMDFLRREAEMQALRRAGLSGEEDLFAPAWASARNRGLWLCINLATAFLASRVIGLFERTIEQSWPWPR